MENNCPNCGSIIEPYNCKCAYCGTWYHDLTLFDTIDNNPRYVKFHTTLNGKEVCLTALARPRLDSIEFEYETEPIYEHLYQCRMIVPKKSCNINMQFECYENGNTHELFQVQML